MRNLVTAVAVAPTATSPSILKAKLPALTFDSPYLSAAEQLRANHSVHECEDAAYLIRWHANVLAELTCRQATAARQRNQDALRTTLRSASFRDHFPGKRHPAPTWVPGSPLPDCADRRAGTFDRRAAARFQPADSLTFAHLLPYAQL